MKTRVWMMVPVLAGAALLGACSDEAGVATAAGEQDPLVERLVEMGARRDRIVDRGDHFVVEGDIRVDKEALREARPDAEPDGRLRPDDPKLQRYVSTVARNRRTVRVNLAAVDAESPDWAAATRAAMANWSAVQGTDVAFVEGGPADITVTFVNSLGGCMVALGAWPASGAPGATVQISRQFAGAYGAGQRTWIMTHELGHNIGLAHTDETFGAIVTGTPATDAGSVMNSGNTFGGCPPNAPNWAAFSANDLLAVRTLYPLWPPTGLVATHPSGTEVLAWDPAPGATGYEYRLLEEKTRDDYNTGTWISQWPEPWTAVPGSPVNTGRAWTGNSQCVWDWGPDFLYYSDYYWQVRAIYPRGTSAWASDVRANVATC